MKYRWITPDREGRADFTVLEYWIEANDRIWQEAREKAQELAKQMNVHSPSGEVRDPKMILANCFAGCIAENAIIFRLNSYAGESGKAVRARPTLFDKSKDNDQVDILVSNEERPEMPGVSIEVRSSYGAYRIIIRDIRNGSRLWGIMSPRIRRESWLRTSISRLSLISVRILCIRRWCPGS